MIRGAARQIINIDDSSYAKTRAIELEFEVQKLKAQLDALEKSGIDDANKAYELSHKITKLRERQFAIDKSLSFLKLKQEPVQIQQKPGIFSRIASFIEDLTNYIFYWGLAFIIFAIAGFIIFIPVSALFK